MGNGYFGGIYFGQYWWPQGGGPVVSTQDLDGSYFLVVDLLGEYATFIDGDGLYAPGVDIPGEVES